MPSQKYALASAFLLSLMLPPLLCKNLLCYHSPYEVNVTREFKLTLTECPPKLVCYKASGHFGGLSLLTDHGCMHRSDCENVRMIKVGGREYNTSYSCCDRPYCNRGTGATPSLATLLAVIGGLFLVIGF